MFVRELEDWARKMGRDAALAFAPIAASDPMSGFRWVSSISAQVSGMDAPAVEEDAADAEAPTEDAPRRRFLQQWSYSPRRWGAMRRPVYRAGAAGAGPTDRG